MFFCGTVFWRIYLRWDHWGKTASLCISPLHIVTHTRIYIYIQIYVLLYVLYYKHKYIYIYIEFPYNKSEYNIVWLRATDVFCFFYRYYQNSYLQSSCHSHMIWHNAAFPYVEILSTITCCLLTHQQMNLKLLSEVWSKYCTKFLTCYTCKLTACHLPQWWWTARPSSADRGCHLMHAGVSLTL